MRLGRTAASLAFTALLAGGAYAADMGYSTPTAAFDWTGFYAGLGITGGAFTTGPTPSNFAALDAIAGVNIMAGQMVLGAEGQLSGYNDFTFGTDWMAKGEIRAGFLASDQVLIYAALAGAHFGGGANYGGIGGGAEFVATDNMTIDIEGVYYPWSNNAYNLATASASVLWHFN